MADPKADLPEGTDKIVNGAMDTTAAVEYSPEEIAGSGAGETSGTTTAGGTSTRGTGSSGSSSGSGSLMDKVRDSSGKLSTQAADKARGMVGQGLERSAEALANVGKLVGETAEGIDERLGEEYGDYARRAAEAIDNAANNLAAKDPDELVDDTREFIRKSPGVALAGAAIVGFAIARLVKSGLSAEEPGEGNKRKRS
jgi:hypothetical protein